MQPPSPYVMGNIFKLRETPKDFTLPPFLWRHKKRTELIALCFDASQTHLKYLLLQRIHLPNGNNM